MSKKIDFSLQSMGPLAFAEKHKLPGYEYCWVGDVPGQVEQYERWGYEIVKDKTIHVGDKKASDSSSLGSAVTVKSKCGQTMYLMAVEDAIFKQRQEFNQSLSKAKLEGLGHIDGIPTSNQYGSITTSYK